MEMISAAQALERLEPAYGDTWPAAIEFLLTDRYESSVVAALMAELQVDGGFCDPIVWARDDEDGVERVVNGMHRLVAALQLDAVVGLLEGFPEGPDPEYVRVTFQLDLPEVAGAEGGPLLAASGLLRSFRLPGGPWVVADVLSGGESDLQAVWNCSHALATNLCNELVARTEAAGGTLTVIESGPERLSSALGVTAHREL